MRCRPGVVTCAICGGSATAGIGAGVWRPSVSTHRPLPHERPWWRVNPAALRAFVRQFPGYLGWVRRMQLIGRAGPDALWSNRLRSGDLARWRAWHLQQQAEE